jgi:hypothetical protein
MLSFLLPLEHDQGLLFALIRFSQSEAFQVSNALVNIDQFTIARTDDRATTLIQ